MKSFMMALVLIACIYIEPQVFSQGGPPNPGDKPLFSTPPLGGGSAPVGSGLFLMLGLSAAYGLKKAYHYNSKEKEEY